MKRLITTCLFALLTASVFAQQTVHTVEFAQRDTCKLYMDIYHPIGESKNTCVVYVFGGGFVMGARNDEHNVRFLKQMQERGYTVCAIDYRLGLKGVTKVSPFSPKPAFAAVRMASEDLVSATKYILDNAKELGVDPRRIVTVGSSAGAITVLQTDYELSSRTEMVRALPADFRYAAVVSLAGSVFSIKGKPVYADKPAPTLFFHGTNDKIVVYKKIQVFNLGMFGTDALVGIFEHEDFSYMALRYEGASHEVAEFPRFYNQDVICDFIDMAADGRYNNRVDVLVKDRYAKDNFKINIQSRKDLYK